MDLTTDELIDIFETLVYERNDGHLTIMRFTTGWKVMPGTPNLDTGAGREAVGELTSYRTLREALIAIIKSYTKGYTGIVKDPKVKTGRTG